MKNEELEEYPDITEDNVDQYAEMIGKDMKQVKFHLPLLVRLRLWIHEMRIRLLLRKIEKG